MRDNLALIGGVRFGHRYFSTEKSRDPASLAYASSGFLIYALLHAEMKKRTAEAVLFSFCGESGIRTRDALSDILPFQGSPFDRSGISPSTTIVTHNNLIGKLKNIFFVFPYQPPLAPPPPELPPPNPPNPPPLEPPKPPDPPKPPPPIHHGGRRPLVMELANAFETM